MLVYILLLFLALFLLLMRKTYFYKISILKTTILLFSWMILAIIYIFRSYDVGLDYSMYHSLFYISGQELQMKFIEPGYIFLNSFAQNHNNFLIISFFAFLVLSCGVICLGYILDVDKFSLISFFILSYIYCSAFNLLRQYIAIGIFCLGLALFIYLYDKSKLSKYLFLLIFILIADQFHSTAIFGIIFIIFPKIFVTKKKIVLSGILTTILFFTNIVRNIFSSLFLIFPNYVEKYSNNSNTLTSFGNKGLLQFLPIIAQFIFIYIYVKYNNNNNNKIRFILSGYLMFLILYTGGGNVIVDRIQEYMHIFPLLFSCVFFDNNKYYNSKNIPIIYKYIFILFWISYYLLRIITNNSGVIPYTFM